MSVQFGVYDFFAYTVPGGLYLFSLMYILASFTGVKFDFASLSNLSIIQVLLIAIPAFITGLVIDRIAVFWYRRFEPKQLTKVVFEKVQARYPNLEFTFQGNDWAVLIAYLQRERNETTVEIHRFNALHILLKNASFNFLILSVTAVILFFYRSFDWLQLLAGIGLMIASIICARQAARFKRWFFASTIEAVVARSLEQDDLVIKHNEPFSLSKNNGSAKRQSTSKKTKTA